MITRKILIYCYDYPPHRSVGALRPYSWAKHLSNFNFSITVLTRKWQENSYRVEKEYNSDPEGIEILRNKNFTTIRIPYKARLKDNLSKIPYIGIYLRKTITLLELILRWKNSSFDEKHFLQKHLQQLLDKENFDLIIVSGEPFILFHHVHKVFLRFKTPYILDYRDGWWYNEVRSSIPGNFINNIIRKIEYKEEQKVISNCLFYISVHDKIINQYQNEFPEKEGYTIENGVDLEELERIKTFPNPFPENKFVIVYTGILYPKHKVSNFLRALEELIKDQPDIMDDLVCFYIGINKLPNSNSKLVENFKLKYPNNVEILESVSHSQSLLFQSNAQLLLKFSSKPQIITGNGAKLYEYAATKNPILTVLPDNDKRTTFFPEKEVQIMCASQNEIMECLRNQFMRWKNGESIKTNLSEEDIFQISRKAQSTLLAAIIERHLY